MHKRVRSRQNKVVKRVKKVFSIFVISIFAVFVSLVLISSVAFYKYLRNPRAQDAQIETDTSINERNTYSFTLVVVEDLYDRTSMIKFLSYVVVNPSEKEVYSFDIPVALEMELSQSLGIQKIERSYALGELIERKQGVELVNKSVEKIFARKSDKYFLTDEPGLSRLLESSEVSSADDLLAWFSVKNLTSVPGLISVFKDEVRSNFSFEDYFALAKFFMGITSDSFFTRLLTEADISNASEIDKTISDQFLDEEVLSEHRRVAVLNGTQKEGLGLFASRVIRNFGADVVRVGNAGKEFEKSAIIADDLASKTVQQVARQLGITNVIKLSESLAQGYDQPVYEDITVILGIDYAQSL